MVPGTAHVGLSGQVVERVRRNFSDRGIDGIGIGDVDERGDHFVA